MISAINLAVMAQHSRNLLSTYLLRSSYLQASAVIFILMSLACLILYLSDG